MLVATSVAGDARVVREASTLAAAGHAVHVVGRDVPAGWVPPEGVTVSGAGGRSAFKPAGAGAPRGRMPVHLRAGRWLLLPEHRNQVFRSWARAALEQARSHQADVVHAHDFTALEIGATLAGERGVPLVYDTHELWAQRLRVGRPTPVQRRREQRVERRLGTEAAAVLTVSEGLADELRRRYGWTHVTVVRNTFPPAAREAGDLPQQPTGVVFAGRIGPDRDLETILAAAPALAPLRLTLLGPTDDDYVARLDLGAAQRLPAVGIEDVDSHLRAAGLSLVTLSPRWLNHRVALPNKLFQAVRAGVPVVATDLPEIRRVVQQHGIGVLYQAGDPTALVRAVREAVARYPELVAAVDRARLSLSWERDAQALLGVYRDLAAAGAR